MDKFISREFGRGSRGEIIHGETSDKRFSRESFIAGYLENNLLSPLCYQGTCDTAFFNDWLEYCLLPEIGSGYTLILDNATFHKSKDTKAMIKK